MTNLPCSVISKLVISFCFLSAMACPAKGQDLDSLRRANLFKFNLLHPFDLDNGFSLAYEHVGEKRNAFHVEWGYGYSNWNLWKSDEDARWNERYGYFHQFRSRIEYRKYTSSIAKGRSICEGPYYGFELLNKFAIRHHPMEVGREYYEYMPTYYELVPATTRKFVSGVHFKLGLQTKLSKNPENPKHPMVIDFFLGLGVRVIYNTSTVTDDSGYSFSFGNSEYPRTLGTIYQGRNHLHPSISGAFGLRLGRLW
ncbi:hypothetical protein LAG90_04690 [Marinilongibacter aquaticus]|uniref:hypothetical protein n=1 Tax=Marinilongibacter aquaticus TaxID=2975157 RepID=UPI0021BCFF9B|nr:hypothetical protein [Marinilongibacter aquaticus]UBM59945.1 hypothetical protein LAG90_04690 [Marinilongibacter aquaticus]